VADVLVEDGRIREVGRGLRARDADVIDAADTIVMPGFVDAHRHVWQTLLRNLGDRPRTAEEFGPAHRPDDVYAATLVGLLSALEAGITTVVDWADLPAGDEFVDAALHAHADAGLRSVFVHGPATWAGIDSLGTDVLRKTADQRLNGPSTMTIAHGSGVPVRRDRAEDVVADWSMARGLGLAIHSHAGVGVEDAGTVSALGARGVLGPDVTLVHCSHLSHEDLDAVAATGTSIVLTPSTEMTAGLGSPPIQALIDRKIRPGLGVDNDREAPGDLLAQMRATISLQHATYFDLRLAGKAGLPNLMTTRQVIRHSTIDGARTAGLGETTGALEPGRVADILVLRTDMPNIVPVNDPVGAVVWGMDTSNIDSVLVGGRIAVRDGEVIADISRARELALSAQQRLVGDTDVLTESGVGGTA